MAKKAEDAKKRFEGMTLTGWQRFSNLFLGRALRKNTRADKGLQKLLLQADIRVMPEVYKATAIMSTVVSFLIFVGILVIAFLPEIGAFAIWENMQNPDTIYPCIDWAFWNKNDINPNLNWGGEGPDGVWVAYGGCPHYQTKVVPGIIRYGLVAFCGLIGPIMTYKYFMGSAEREKKARSEELEKYLPYAASYTAAMSAANATPAKIFRSLAMNKEIYGNISYDSAMIYRDINLLGMDLVSAIKLSVDRAASPWVSEFFQGMVGTLSSGGNLKIYFLNRAEHYMRENRIRLGVFLETLAMMAESYVVVAVAMPLFLIVMLVIMFWVSGAGSELSEEMVYGVVLVVLPVIHIAYSALVWLMSKEMEM
tara:strand:+ start:367 stop:1464 length:1098 start_codon:yes stop_codon:yes gene_type:complete